MMTVRRRRFADLACAARGDQARSEMAHCSAIVGVVMSLRPFFIATCLCPLALGCGDENAAVSAAAVTEPINVAYVCTGAADEAGHSCDDGDPCTTNDQCAKGSCVGGERLGLLYGGKSAEEALAIAVLPDGGVALAGYTTSQGAGKEDAWLVRTDGKGNRLWDFTYGGPTDDRALALARVIDGYVLAGYTNAGVAKVGADLWLVRTDLSGKSVWQKTYGGPGVDYANAMNVLDNGHIRMAGYAQTLGKQTGDADVVEVDADGKLLWDKTFGGEGDDFANAMIVLSDSGFLAVGSTPVASRAQDGWFVRADATGTALWTQTFGGGSNDAFQAVVPVGDGFAATGYTQSSGNGSSDLWLVRTDGSGKKLWEKTFGTPQLDTGNAIAVLSNGNFAIGGDTKGKVVGKTTEAESWLLYVDSQGAFVSEWTYGVAGKGQNFINAITTLPDGGVALAGATDAHGTTLYDMWLVRTDAAGKSTCQ